MKTITKSECLALIERKREKHGMTNTIIYRAWAHMKTRCNNPKDKSYHLYGGRGISVCERWDSFQNFYKDMGATWKKGLSLERIDNNKGYCPENCKWATTKQQSRNTRWNRKITYKGRTMILTDWAKEVGLAFNTLQHRLNTGWTVKKALEVPLNYGRWNRYEIDGKSLTTAEWSRISGVRRQTISSRIKAGWPLKKAVFSPPQN